MLFAPAFRARATLVPLLALAVPGARGLRGDRRSQNQWLDQGIDGGDGSSQARGSLHKNAEGGF